MPVSEATLMLGVLLLAVSISFPLIVPDARLKSPLLLFVWTATGFLAGFFGPSGARGDLRIVVGPGLLFLSAFVLSPLYGLAYTYWEEKRARTAPATPVGLEVFSQVFAIVVRRSAVVRRFATIEVRAETSREAHASVCMLPGRVPLVTADMREGADDEWHRHILAFLIAHELAHLHLNAPQPTANSSKVAALSYGAWRHDLLYGVYLGALVVTGYCAYFLGAVEHDAPSLDAAAFASYHYQGMIGVGLAFALSLYAMLRRAWVEIQCDQKAVGFLSGTIFDPVSLPRSIRDWLGIRVDAPRPSLGEGWRSIPHWPVILGFATMIGCLGCLLSGKFGAIGSFMLAFGSCAAFGVERRLPQRFKLPHLRSMRVALVLLSAVGLAVLVSSLFL